MGDWSVSSDFRVSKNSLVFCCNSKVLRCNSWIWICWTFSVCLRKSFSRIWKSHVADFCSRVWMSWSTNVFSLSSSSIVSFWFLLICSSCFSSIRCFSISAFKEPIFCCKSFFCVSSFPILLKLSDSRFSKSPISIWSSLILFSEIKREFSDSFFDFITSSAILKCSFLAFLSSFASWLLLL